MKIIGAKKTSSAAVAEVKTSATACCSGSIGARSTSDTSVRIGVTTSKTARVTRDADIAHICIKILKAAASTVQIGLDIDL